MRSVIVHFPMFPCIKYEPGKAFPTRLYVRPAKTQIIRSACRASAQSDQSSHGSPKDLKRLHAESEDSDHCADAHADLRHH